MKTKYQKWIDEYQGETQLQCMTVTQQMNKVFPELTLVKGIAIIDVSQTLDAFIEDESEEPHAWLVDPEIDEIIDPTKSQWESQGMPVLRYEAFPKGTEQMGRCHNCGKYFPDKGGMHCCSVECSRQLDNYLNNRS